MQVTEVKSSFSTSPNLKARPQPFFNQEEERSFFSKSNEHTTFSFSPATIQPKLTIGQPNDKYKVEADAIADTVVKRPSVSSNQNISTGIVSPGIQRKCESCEEEKNLHKKEDGFTENTVIKKSLKSH